MGFLCSRADPFLFTYKNKDHKILILIYVDVVLLTGSNTVLLVQIISHSSKQFALKDVGMIRYFLGLEIKYIKGLFLSQQPTCFIRLK